MYEHYHCNHMGILYKLYFCVKLDEITFLIYNAKISDNNAESGKVPQMLAAFPR
jgi:hypothetical protein